uniref:thiamine pyrophosphate-binding protein n=1 Tax=Fulvivirga sp. TaxID=1931237 RepID=UPI00404A927C
MENNVGIRVKISDLVIDEIARAGVDTFFGVTGGAAVHFFDSIEKNPMLKAIYCNHEQGAAFAVEAYAKTNKKFGAGIFTTGPGGTNALTGLAAAWLDSIPCIFISGQARTNQTVNGRNLRQVGTQEVDIISMVKSVTKYATTIYDIKEVKYHLQKAIYLALHGRPGPVWLDIPVDIQWSFTDSDELIDFDPESEGFNAQVRSQNLAVDILKVAQLIKSAKRPVVLAGYGVRLSNAEDALLEFIKKFQIPFVSTWNLVDWVTTDHDLNLGRPGLSGQRGANLALQNSDLIIAIGSHLNATIVGTRPELFARDADIVMVDIDLNELENCPIHIEVSINQDVKKFLQEISSELGQWSPFGDTHEKWKALCDRYKSFNRIALDYSKNQDLVNTYYFKYLLSKNSQEGDIFVVDGGGTIVYSALQSIEIKPKQRIILSAGLCSMGSGIPEAIGAHFASPQSQIYCFVGDGSFPFNMQELQIIKDLKLPIKIFVFNNSGYVSIRTTQNEFLDGRIIGSSPESGLHLLNISKIADAFDLPYSHISSQESLEDVLTKLLLKKGGPLVCEVMVSDKQEIVPRQGFAVTNGGQFEPRPIEDMHPFLDRTLFKSLMVVPDSETPEASGLVGHQIDLMKNYPHQKRPIKQRFERKRAGDGYVGFDEYGNLANDILFEQLVLNRSKTFDKNYFDGSRQEGYGGYSYDKKYWHKVAQDIIAYYKLKPGDRILEVGCAKGFLLHDLLQVLPGLKVKGIDISDYAVSQALPDVREDILVGDAVSLPFEDKSFDLVISLNTLSELSAEACKKAIHEIGRVSKDSSFITLNSWRNKRERDQLQKWNLTALSNHSIPEWMMILSEVGYKGDFYWFFTK